MRRQRSIGHPKSADTKEWDCHGPVCQPACQAERSPNCNAFLAWIKKQRKTDTKQYVSQSNIQKPISWAAIHFLHAPSANPPHPVHSFFCRHTVANPNPFPSFVGHWGGKCHAQSWLAPCCTYTYIHMQREREREECTPCTPALMMNVMMSSTTCHCSENAPAMSLYWFHPSTGDGAGDISGGEGSGDWGARGDACRRAKGG